MRNREPDEFDVDPSVQVSDETCDASSDLHRPSEAYHHLPWAALDHVMGGMPGGEVCIPCAFSSQGKTTFLTSLLDETFETTQKKIYFMPLETRPKIARTHWAAKRCGIDAGDLLSGAFLKWANWREVRDMVSEEIMSQNRGDKFDRVRFAPTSVLSADKLYRAADHAADFGADYFIIDHMDQTKGSYEDSIEVTRAIMDIAQSYGFLMMPSSQLNNEAVKQNRIALHLAPQPQHVKYGGHKREIATWMIGLYRPLKLAGVSAQDLQAANAGRGDMREILEPNTMAVVFMKHRIYGSREWSKVYLRVDRGKVFDADQTIYTAKTVSSDGMRMSP